MCNDNQTNLFATKELNVITMYLYICLTFSLCLISLVAAVERLHFQQYITNSGDSAQIYISNIAIQTCVKMCKMRRTCKFINYMLGVHGCFIVLMYGKNSNFVANVRSGYIAGDKSEWDMSDFDGCSICSDNEVCHVRTNITECEKTDCPPPSSLQNATIHGNMHSIGSALTYKCNENFTMDTSVTTDVITCNANGVWTDINFACVSPTTTTTSTTSTTTTPTTTTTLTTTTTTTTTPALPCQKTRNTFQSQWLSDGTLFTFVVVKEDLDQPDAIESCINDYGASLVQITTPVKMAFLQQLLSCEAVNDGDDDEDYWIDGNNKNANEIWRTSDNIVIPMGGTYWYKTESYNKNNCVRMVRKRNYLWDDKDCDNDDYFYICEKK